MKEEVLKALRQNREVSGGELGRTLGISRTAVWKCINSLRAEGYQIESTPSKGYCLVGVPDRLLPGEIREGLKTSTLGCEIVYRSEVDSTQVLAKSMAMAGASAGTVVIGEKQTGGFGRLGRKWHSLPGSVSFSVILRPPVNPLDALKYPIIAGVAVAGAVEEVAGLKPQLKWPNDIILGGKKAGGIVTEMAAEIDRVSYLIIGIGVNVNTAKSQVPEDIKDIATSLKIQRGKEVSRVRLVQAILEELESLSDEFKITGFEPIRKQWEELSCTIGHQVYFARGDKTVEGEAVAMDSDGALVIRETNGNLDRVLYGDVNLKKSEGQAG